MSTPSSIITPGVSFDANGKKTFIPLENNPEVLTSLAHTLGLSADLSFHDVYSVTEPDLLALVPQPVHALIFIAPAPVFHRIRANEAPGPLRDHYLAREAAGKDVQSRPSLTYSGKGPEEPVVWFQQTIGHACGLIALLHSMANGPARQSLTPGSIMDRLLSDAEPLGPKERAELLYSSKELEETHMAAAKGGQSEAPESHDPNGYHFIAFVRGGDGHLYELEGSSDGPVDRGVLEDGGGSMLSEEALDKSVRRYIAMADGLLEFSIVALAASSQEA